MWTGEAARYPQLLSIVRRHDDIAGAKKDGTLGLILGFQNTEMLERDLSRLETFRQLGVLIIQLTYNIRNLIGDGCLEPGDAGISEFGREAIGKMNALGIAVDLSHCGTRTTAPVSPRRPGRRSSLIRAAAKSTAIRAARRTGS